MINNEEPIFISLDQITMSNIILSVISIIVSIITVVIYLTSKSLHKFTLTMMFGIASSEIVNGIGHVLSFNFIGVNKDNIKQIDSSVICGIQRFCLIYPDLCTMLFLVFLSYSIYDLIKNNSKELENKISLYTLIGFLVPLVITAIIVTIVLFLQQEDFDPKTLTKDGQMIYKYKYQCYVDRSSVISNTLYIVTFGLNGVMLYYIFSVIAFMKKEVANKPKMINIKNKLYNYPIAGSLCFVFVLLYRLHELFFHEKIYKDKSEFALRIYFLLIRLHGTFLSLRGVILFIIFLGNNKVQCRIREIMEKVFTNIDNITILQLPKVDETVDTFEIKEVDEEDEEDEKDDDEENQVENQNDE